MRTDDDLDLDAIVRRLKEAKAAVDDALALISPA